MAHKLVVTKDGAIEVPLTPEEVAQQAVDEQQAATDQAAQDADRSRRQLILDQMQVWDDRLRNKTLSEIVTTFNNADASQKEDLLLYLTLTRSLELR